MVNETGIEGIYDQIHQEDIYQVTNPTTDQFQIFRERTIAKGGTLINLANSHTMSMLGSQDMDTSSIERLAKSFTSSDFILMITPSGEKSLALSVDVEILAEQISPLFNEELELICLVITYIKYSC